MKCAFGEFHLWYQVALSMVACGKVRYKAVGVEGGSLLDVGSSSFSEFGAGDVGVDWEVWPSIGMTF